MSDTSPAKRILESRLSDTAGVYVNEGVDAESYFQEIADDIRRNECEPFELDAIVEQPGFPHLKLGERVSGMCVAHKPGYWLVYRSEDKNFYMFWGEEENNLGSPGVFGSPLYCWSA